MHLETLACMFFCLETSMITLLTALKIRTWQQNRGVKYLTLMLAGICGGYFLQSVLVAILLIFPDVLGAHFGTIFIVLMLLAVLPINGFCLYALNIANGRNY